MGAQVVAFKIPEEIGGVLRWFMAALRPLSGVRYRESQGVGLVLEEPREENPREPDVNMDIVVRAYRIKEVPTPSRWLPEHLVEGFDTQREPPGPVMLFRFSARCGETCVWATCAEGLPPVQKVFEDFLRQIEACYPVVGPLGQEYETERIERVKENLKTRFGETETRRYHAGALTAGGDAATPQRRRGRKRTDPKEINKICADWLKVQDRVTQIDFCNGKGISPSRLRSWLKDYPYPES